MRSSPRIVTVLAFALAASISACDKGGSTTPPAGDGAAAGDGAEQAQGTTLRYAAAPKTLQQNVTFETTQSGGGQFAEAKLQLVAKLAVDKDADKLKVIWNVEQVENLELGGALEPKEGDDPKAYVTEQGKGAYLTDLRGETDEEASEGLPENAAAKAEMERMQKEMQEQAAAGKQPAVPAGVMVMAFLPRALQLPTLPEQTLEVGKPAKIEREEEQVLGETGIVLPLEIETTYTLVKIDDSGGNRIAEVRMEGEAGGATETQMGMITYASSYEGTLLFDLDAQVPVSYERQNTDAYELGQLGSQESTVLLRSEWKPL